MSPRWLVGICASCLLFWWYCSPDSWRVPAPPAFADSETPHCPLPLRVMTGDPPLQTEVPEDVKPFRLEVATLQPLAGFSIDARVLSRENYAFDPASKLSPTDLLLGWDRMTDDDVLSKLTFSQSGRWGEYRWTNQPPIAPDEIAKSTTNMHIIPYDDDVARELRRVRKGDRVRIHGWLIEATGKNGWRWRSSLTRDDTGNGACEVVYVCSMERY